MSIKSALWSLAGASVLLGLGAVPAQAGNFGSCGGVGNCDVPVQSVRTPQGYNGPMTIANHTPYDYLDSVHFQHNPHVSITRIHGRMPTAALADAPSGFTQGCHPQSTQYCRADAGRPVSVQFNAPVMPAPVYQAPTERVVAVGGGYDPSAFVPRQYGDLSITPGIVHAPTSIIDRSPQNAQAVLDAVAPGSVTPALSGLPIRGQAAPALPMMQAPMMQAPVMPAPMMQAPVMRAPVMMAPPMMRAPMPAPMQAPVMGSIPSGYPGAAGAPVLQANGSYGSNVGADGTYWEKVSGPTVMGSTIATQVICKRKLPTQVVNPTIGVPVPVPTPVVVPGCDLPASVAPYERRY